MRDPLRRTHEIGSRPEGERRVLRPDHQVSAHAAGEIQDDCGFASLILVDDLAKQGRIAAAGAGLRIPHVQMHDGGAGGMGVERRGGDLRPASRAHEDSSPPNPRTGHRTGNEDFGRDHGNLAALAERPALGTRYRSAGRGI